MGPLSQSEECSPLTSCPQEPLPYPDGGAAKHLLDVSGLALISTSVGSMEYLHLNIVIIFRALILYYSQLVFLSIWMMIELPVIETFHYRGR